MSGAPLRRRVSDSHFWFLGCSPSLPPTVVAGGGSTGGGGGGVIVFVVCVVVARAFVGIVVITVHIVLFLL